MNKKYYLCNIIFFTLLTIPGIAQGQTYDRNYIMSETLLDSTGAKTVRSVQYYDGFGRADILATGGLSPSKKYVCSLTEYDSLGRESKSWLPAVGTITPNFMETETLSTLSQETYGGDGYAFSEITYDALGRPTFTATPGQLWHQNEKGVRTGYRTNLSSDYVKHYVMTSVTGGTFSLQGFYSPATLTSIKTTDEDGHTTEVYKDFMDNVILERRSGNNDTYYVYDKGLLCVVIPPLYRTTNNNDLLYKYKYDNHGRCIEKKFPGCTPIKYEYDKYGRIAFVQDGCMSANTYRYYLYDQLGRQVVRGICTHSGSSSFAGLPAVAVYGSGDREITGTGYYVGSGYGLTNPTIEIVNYYDSYLFLENASLQDSINNVNLNMSGHVNATSLMTGQLVKTSDGHYLCSALYYDRKGNVVKRYENTLGGGTLCTATDYSFTGKPVEVREELTRKGVTKTVIQQNTYDTGTDILSSRIHKYNNASPVTTASYAYDDLGRIDSIGRNENKVSTRYAYDVHGWITDIHGQDVMHAKSLFDEQIRYADYPSSVCYNGNIGCTKFITPDNPMGDGYHCSYEYAYDSMNRLINASFGYGLVGTDYGSNTNFFSENMTYDDNSNITSLVRQGVMNNGYYGVIDNLTYSHYGNKLYGITDQASNLLSEGAFDFKDNTMNTYEAPEYGYNNNGAQTYDANKGISWINYDLTGNPIRIQFANHNVTEYVYAADGRRLKTTHRTSVPRSDMLGTGGTATLTASETMSVDSAEYIGNFICDNGTPKRYCFDDGYLMLYNTTFTPRYYIKDHLGNNRMVVTGAGAVYQNNNCYPYGGMTALGSGQGYQQFKYNGKEYDPMHGLDEYDYGARQYDPAIGRFTTIDPLCEKYYHISPYTYCAGNPVKFVDPDGRRPSAYEAALMAAHSYGDKYASDYAIKLEKMGWIPSTYDTSILMNYTNLGENGLQSELFQREINGKIEYAYVYAGTNSTEDICEDFAQLAGLAPQYSTAIHNAQILSKELGDNELTFVGHSLGGGEAAASSMTTGRAAITFNPASVSALTGIVHELGNANKVTNYIAAGVHIGRITIGGDPINNLQDNFGIRAPGKTIRVPIGLKNQYTSHKIETLLQYIKKWR